MFENTIRQFKRYLNFFSLDAWLLFILMTYSLYCTRSFFYTINFLYWFMIPSLFILLVLYAYHDYKNRGKDKIEKTKVYKKKFLFIFLIISVFLVGYLFVTFENSQHLVSQYTHDEIILSEYALKYFKEGKNPYSENYYHTPLVDYFPDKSIYVFGTIKVFNPAFVTYAYLPAQFLVPLPFYLFFENVFHWYDHRIFYFFCLLLILFILYRLVKEKHYRLLLLVTFFFFIDFWGRVYYGFNDLQSLLFLLLCFYFLKRKKIMWSAFFLVLGLVSKQSAFIVLPFYFLYLFKSEELKEKTFVKKVVYPSLIIIFIILLVITPFFLWHREAFINDVFEYQTGRSSMSYPMNGFGFSRLLYILGLFDTPNNYFPFSLWQIFIVGPLLIFLVFKQWKENNLKRLILNYAITLFVFWFFSRSFLGSHLAYISTFLPIAYFIEF